MHKWMKVNRSEFSKIYFQYRLKFKRYFIKIHRWISRSTCCFAFKEGEKYWRKKRFYFLFKSFSIFFDWKHISYIIVSCVKMYSVASKIVNHGILTLKKFETKYSKLFQIVQITFQNFLLELRWKISNN